jgi:single-stranded-DNA-specific exonuclease
VRERHWRRPRHAGSTRPLVWAAEDGWHPGVVGIVASRLKEHTHRPAVVIGFDGEEGKGSGRSVSGVDLGASIQRLAAEGLIEKGGGHRMAAGLSLNRAQLEPAMARLTELLARQGAGDGRRGRPAARRRDDARGRDAGADRADRGGGPLRRLGPCPALRLSRHAHPHDPARGRGPPETRLLRRRDRHIDAIAFDAARLGLDALQNHQGRPVHLAGRVELNHWNGRSRVQLRLEDAAWAE